MGEPAVVYGYSLGGIVALYLASRHPTATSALIVEEPGLFDTIFDIPWVPRAITEWRDLLSSRKTLAELRGLLNLSDAHGRRRAKVLSQLDPGTLDAFLNRSWSCHREGFDVERLCRSVSCPVLLIHGNPESGSVLSQDQAHYLQSTLPDCVSEYVVDAGHGPHSEQLVKISTMIVNFLGSL